MFNRHDYYQKPEEVVVTIFTKAIPMQNVNIDFGEQIVSTLRTHLYEYDA